MKNKEQLSNYWVKYAKDNLVGKTIKSVRYMFDEEIENLSWGGSSLVIEFTDGTIIFPSTDDEGNGPGALFGNKSNGDELLFPVL